ncbi:MAG: twin arginine translocation system, TatC protein [Pseudomonadota bacterium]|jgi:sec-independent protein translocase protein TatC
MSPPKVPLGKSAPTKSADDEAFPRSDDGFDDPVEKFQMPLMEHLLELRRRLMWTLLAVTICVAGAMAFVEQIWDFLVSPMNEALSGTSGTMAITEPLEGFMTYLKVAGVAGLTASTPVIFWQFWRFVAPGLYPNEKKYVIPLVFSSTALFLLGATFCYFVIFTYAFPFFISVTSGDVQAVLSISAYLSLVTKMLVAFGASFQLPVIVFVLARMGLIDHIDMVKFFRYAIVAIFVVAAILTPPDVLSQVLMAAPLTVLYIIGIGIAWMFTTKERDADEDEAAPAGA